MPSNRIRQYKTRKETERRPQETKKTVQNKKRNGKASAIKKRRKETARRSQETKTNEKIE